MTELGAAVEGLLKLKASSMETSEISIVRDGIGTPGFDRSPNFDNEVASIGTCPSRKRHSS